MLDFDRFPYGKAPLIILLVAVAAGGVRLLAGRERPEKADLVFTIFASNHRDMYESAIAAFEKSRHVKVHMQLVHREVLGSRLQAALQTGADVPDLVEVPSIANFVRGPLKDVELVDLTDRLHSEGLFHEMVESRYFLWSNRERVFALPHDVHPVALCYRRDLIQELGIDVAGLKTWEDFARIGRQVTRDLNGDGVPDRYMLDAATSEAWLLEILMLQRGANEFDAQGRVVFDDPEVADLIVWYIHQTRGRERIAVEAGFGQPLYRAMLDGLVLFVICPDWRSKQLEIDVPSLKGKLALMPLPAWKAGGCRTGTWGATGLVITKACRRQDLAWDLAKFLYLDKEELAKRFAQSYIITPVKAAWKMPAFDVPNPFYGGQAIGRLYTELASETPASYSTPYSQFATDAVSAAYLVAARHFDEHGDEGLREVALAELKKGAEYVRRIAARNPFQNPS